MSPGPHRPRRTPPHPAAKARRCAWPATAPLASARRRTSNPAQQYTPSGTGGTGPRSRTSAPSAPADSSRPGIASDSAVRISYLSGTAARLLAKVPRVDGLGHTERRDLRRTSPRVAGKVSVVGRGNAPGQRAPDNATAYAGPVVNMDCVSCHNPHGNGQYRILNPIPDPAVAGGDTFVPAAVAATVTDAALPPAGDARNYTVIQTNGGTGTLLASQVTALAVPAHGGRLLPPKGPLERDDRYVERRAERPVRELHHPDLGLVPHVPHARTWRQRSSTRQRRRDLQVPAHLEQHVAKLHHVPRGARLQRADGRTLLQHDQESGWLGRPGRRQPPPEDRQPRHLPGLPRSDGDDHCASPPVGPTPVPLLPVI